MPSTLPITLPMPTPSFGSDQPFGSSSWMTEVAKKVEKAGDPYGVIGRLKEIVEAGGLTPQQRAMLSAAMNRQLGLQAEQAGQSNERRAAAQGISGMGLANAMQGNVMSGLLSAQQQGEEALNEYGLGLYQNALRTLLEVQERAKDRQAQREAEGGGGFGGLLGGLAGLFTGNILGPIGSKIGLGISNKIFGEDED